MKSAIFAITALAVAVAAQDQNNLPECAQTCVNNMRSQMKAEELGCREGDIRCLCTNPNFSYGLRDCTSEVCGNREQDVNTVFDYARNICQQAGVAIATTGGASGSGGASPTSGGGQETVATVLSTFSSGGSAMTTAVATTTISGGAASSQSSNSDSNNASQTPSASHSGSGNNGGGGAGNTGTGGASSTSSGFAPQMTAAPVGMLAVAGIAAFMM